MSFSPYIDGGQTDRHYNPSAPRRDALSPTASQKIIALCIFNSKIYYYLCGNGTHCRPRQLGEASFAGPTPVRGERVGIR